MNTRYLVSVEAANLRVEVWVNRIPVGTLSPHEESPAFFPVNQFLVEGSNKIGVTLHANPVPSLVTAPWNADPAAATYHGPAKLSLKLANYTAEQIPMRDHPPVLASIDWNGQAVSEPAYTEKEVTIKGADGPWAWEQANVFPALDGDLRHQVIDYISYLHGLLEQKKFEAFIAESELRLAETSKAYDLPPAPLRADMLQGLQQYSAAPFHLDPLDQASIDLRLIANGRMIECTRRNRDHVLIYRKQGSPEQLFLPLMVGQRQGKWTVLR